MEKCAGLRDPQGRIRLDGEIASGGMGTVLKGRDTDLGRDIAVKVLLEAHQGKTEFVQRFVEEAQIAGQLQHPGIVPVYELGQFPDRRPYFTMKLVKGKTLALFLAGRKDLVEERAKFLGIFEQVCQTLAYAHARGVIHRDLKPSNVMVGAFGEVQVMDWGLAKVLAEGGGTDEQKTQLPPEASVIRTLRSEGADRPEQVGSHTHAGSVLGTPAYMAPEQARGEVDLVDERADVFGLGAILCEILTGRPPFTGKTVEAQHKAQTAQLQDAYARLDGCGADPELIALAKRCLAPEPWDRPRRGGEAATAVAAYQHSVAERLRQAELAGVEARARAAEERKRRKLTLALAASVLLTMLLGGGGWLWIGRQQAAREREALARAVETTRQIHEALTQANTLREQARAANDDPARWAEVRARAKEAETLLENGPAPPELVERVRGLMRELNDEENDRRLMARLDQIQLAKSDVDVRASTFAEKRALPEYAHAFAEHGLNVLELPVHEAARRIGQRSAKVREALVAALDDWLELARRFRAPEADGLARVVDAADRDPWRQQVRLALARDDQGALERLAGAAEFGQQRPQTILLLARHTYRKFPQRVVELLRSAQQRFPADFWINYTLAGILDDHAELPDADLREYDEAIRFTTAALALRPDNPRVLSQLGRLFSWRGRQDEALAAFRRALDLAPGLARAHRDIGLPLQLKGQIDAAAAAYRKAVALQPDASWAHNNVGLILWVEGRQHDEAIGEFRRALILPDAIEEPTSSGVHGTNLGIALLEKGRFNEAAVVFQKAVAFAPELARAAGLGLLISTGRPDAAVALCRKAIAAQPEDAKAYVGVAWGLTVQGKYAEALPEFQHGRDLGLKRPSIMTTPVVRWTEECERLKVIDGQWPVYVEGKVKPQDRAERRLLTLVYVIRKQYLAAARLHAEALTTDARWADDLDAEARYDAARFAALVADGQGQNAAQLAAGERSRWRRQAVDWLRAELTRQAKHLESAPSLDHSIALARLRWWQQEPDLAAVRDPAILAKLPAEEREACLKLWAEVDALLKRSIATSGRAQQGGARAQLELIHVALAAAEELGASGQVSQVGTNRFLADQSGCLVSVASEVAGPAFECARVVRTQALDMECLESASAGGLQHALRRRNVAAGEDFRRQKVNETQKRERLARLAQRDCVQQQNPIAGQQFQAAGEKGGVFCPAKVLEGADRHDAVHRLRKRLPPFQAEIKPRPSGGQHLIVVILIPAQGQADDGNAMPFVSPRRGRPPTAADVKQPLAALQLALGQRGVDLGTLGIGEAHV
jgi:serine/threonine-protein kinase